MTNYYFVDVSDIWGRATVLGGAPTRSAAQEVARKHALRNYKSDISLWSGIGPWYSSPLAGGVELTYRVYASEISSRVVQSA